MAKVLRNIEGVKSIVTLFQDTITRYNFVRGENGENGVDYWLTTPDWSGRTEKFDDWAAVQYSAKTEKEIHPRRIG